MENLLIADLLESKHGGSGNQSRCHHQRRKLAVFREDLGTSESSRSHAWEMSDEFGRNVEEMYNENGFKGSDEHTQQGQAHNNRLKK